MPKRLCIIGLDCVTPELLFGPWLAEMPNIRRLIAAGTHAHMVSTLPPITVPAWMSMMTSHDPGMLGIYGFKNRASHGYDDVFIVNGKNVTAKPLWYHLSRNKLTSIVLGVPLTYPPQPLRGVLAASFLTPSKEVTWTFPASLGKRLDEWAGGNYIIDVEDFRNERKQETLDQIYRMTEGRFRAFRKLLEVEPWDFAMMVEMGPDRMHHAFWRYMDKTHRLYEPGNPFEDAMRKYYIYMDREIGRTLDALPEGTSVIVVSDHGAKPMQGAICINEWLIEQGLLTLKSYPDQATKLTTGMVDWSRTKAWGEGGYYARMFLNVEGREPQGVIPAAELPAFKRELKAKLEAITDPEGKNIGTRVFFPEDVYRETRGVPPDLIVYLGNLDWRSAGTVGGRSIHLFENDTGPDDANHAEEGIFIWHGRGDGSGGAGGAAQAGGARGGTMAGAGSAVLGAGGAPTTRKVSIYDIAPSILDYFGIAVPTEMIGAVLPK